MFRRSLLFAIVLFAVVASVHAQYIVIGPPDDPTTIDTSYHPPAPFTRGPSTPLLSAATTSVSTITLSQLDCSRFPYICLYVDALNGSSVPVPGLTKDSFCLYQDGVPITTPNFTVQQLTTGNCPTSICLVADVSGSMGDNHKIDSLKAAMHRFVNNMDVYDQVAIVTFSNCWTVLQSFTSNKTTLNNAINTLVASGNTAAFDGIWKGVDVTRTQLGSKAVIAFTDGLENRSQSCSPNPPNGINDGHYNDDSTTIVSYANAASIPIYTFNLGPIDTTFYNPYALQAFSKGTGGAWAHAPTGSGIDSLYTLIKQRLCSRYYICYTSTDTIQNGDIHWVKVCKKTGATCSPCDSSSCQEMAPPVIVRTPTTINLSNTCQPWTNSVTVCAYVTDKDTPKSGLTVTLFYRTGPSSYTSIPMTSGSDSTFCGTIPASDLKCMSGVDYYITASDGHATVSIPVVNPQASPYHFAICPNHPPVANAGPDQTIFQCTAAQICLPASCSDPDGNLQSCQLISGPGTYNGSQICFTPTGTLNYEFVLKATDSCGLTSFDTVVVFYTLNHAPVANAGRDSTLFLCAPQQICWAASATDPDNNLDSAKLIAGAGVYNGSSICFTPSSSGTYTFILKAFDHCGLTSQDTAVINVTMNVAPVCHIPNDTTIFQCTPTQVCLPYSSTDANNNLRSCQIISGPGSLVGGNWCYTPPATQTVTVTIRCDDSCNASCQSSFTVHFNVDQKPVIAFGNDTTIFQCTPQQICLPYTVSDADNNLTLEQLVSGSGTIDTANNRVCFTPASAGTYTFIVRAADACGQEARDTINVTVNTNHPPVVNAGPDQTIFQCSPAQICWAVSSSDPDGNLDSTKLISGPGVYNGSTICFTPSVSGTSTFILKAYDHCGLTATDTVNVNVTINSKPTVAFGADTTLFLCQPQSVCMNYTVSDPNGLAKLTEVLVSGFGSIDTANNKVCFTPTTTGTYQFIVSVTDSCGASSRDTINANITFGTPAAITCPSGTISTFLCSAGQVCQPLTITPGSATVTSSFGTYSGGNLCFQADTSGTYHIRVIAATTCKTDTCNVTFAVTINHKPVVNAGPDQTIFQCSPAQICWAVSSSDPDGNLDSTKLISGPGVYNGSTICFTPSVSGTSTFILKAYDHCGLTATDTVNVNVTINSKPTVAFGADTTLFLCQPQSVCMNYTVSDPNGLAKLTEVLVSGFGSIDTANNKVCFTPTTTGTYQFIVSVTDSCGASSRDTINANITFGTPAAITCPSGTISTFLCSAGQVCQPLTITPGSATVTSSFGTYSGGNLCFQADTSGTYHIRVIAATTCKTDTCNVTFAVTINHKPVVNAGPDQTIFQCSPAQICWAVSSSDPDGNLDSTKLISGPGVYNGSTICFTPSVSGTSTFILKAYDHCGLTATDTVNVNVTINSKPTVAFGADTTLFLCQPQSVCMNYTVSDPNGLAKLTEVLVSGFGSIDTANNKVCFTPTTTGTYQFIVSVTDSCGASSRDTINANITFGTPAAITCPSGTISTFLCSAGQVCQPLTITPGSATVTSSFGTYSGGNLCFQADTSGTYHIRVIAATTCKTDTCNVTFAVTINHKPVVNAGPDQTIFQCSPAQICWAVSSSDPDGNLDSTKLISGPGVYNGSTICFTPSVSGTSTFILKAYDHCGLTATDTVNVNVTINSKPTVAFGADTTLFLCQPQSVCMNYTVSDPNGLAKLTEVLVSGFGSIDTANNKVCFTPTTTGTYQFIVSVTDSCGASSRDTINANITFGTMAHITCPATPITASLCAVGQVCQQLTITPANATVTTSFGTYSGGNLCFQADTSGTYHIRVIAATSCSADTCNVTFNVTIGQAAHITCPAPQTKFICQTGQVCIPVSIMGSGATVTVTPIGTFNAGDVCFQADTTGHYVIKIKASTTCGSDSCQLIADVTIDSPPVATNPSTPKDTFLCASAQICYQFAATDPNGGALTWSKLNGVGAVSASGQWCFTPTTNGSYAVTAVVADSCGKADTTTLTYNITINSAPVVKFGNDTTIAICSGSSICLPYTVTDANNNVTLEQLISGTGTIDTVLNKVCFTPATAGNYSFIVKATDACGANSSDTINVAVTVGVAAHVSCPAPATKFLCTTGSVCYPVTITGSTPTVTVTPIGSYSGGNVCFQADTTGHYVLKVKATNNCGADSCSLVVDVTIDSPPVATNPSTPKDTFLCASAQICYQFAATDPNGGALTWSKLNGVGAVSASGQWCFTPTTNGSYAVTAVVADSCGKADTTTLTYNITINSAPVVKFGNDTTIAICSGSSICLPYTVTDANNNVTLEQLISGTGTIDTVLNKVCFTPATAGNYSFIVKATDACGANSSDTINVAVTVGVAAHVSCPAPATKFLCTTGSVCYPVTITGSTPTVTVTPIGSYSGGNVCFQADTTGHYVLKVKATNNCGADSCSLVVDVTIDSPPVATNPSTPKDTFLCASAQICYQFAATDPNGGALTWSKLNGVGAVSASGQWCFTPTTNGSYAVTAVVADSCGKADTTTLTYNITINSAPVVKFGNDTTIAICSGSSICLPYTVTDANNNVTLEQLISGTGTIDTVLNKVCFTPATAGNYSFIVKATDACGANSSDTINVAVTVGVAAHVSCPAPATKFLCTTGSVCYPVTITGSTPTVTVTPIGSYSGGNVCFQADTTGHYVLKVKATNNCGADSCSLVVDVTIDSPPVATNPSTPKDTFLCASAQICYQFAATDPNGGVLYWSKISGAGSVSGTGLWCFTPTTNGSYAVTAVVADSCGKADTTTLTYNITLNQPPVVSLGADVVKALCLPSQICVPYTVTDPNNNVVSEQLLSGPGTIDTVANKVCFTANTAGVSTFIVKATDACGASGVDTVKVIVSLNRPPVVNAGADQTLFQCAPTQVCWNVTASDPDNNLDSLKLISGPGTLSTNGGNKQICFTPTSAGVYSFILRAVDSCGASAQDTVAITINLNAPPVCSTPHDTTTFQQCVPTQVSLPVSGTDPDGNFDHCEIASGPGSIVGGQWIYTPSTDEFHKIVIRCLDKCGASCTDSFYVRFKLNAPPVVNSGKDTTFFLCQSTILCWPVTASDPNNNLMSVQLLSGPGTYDPIQHQICAGVTYAQGQTKVLTFIVKATDSCNVSAYDTTTITVNFDHPPTITAPPSFTAYMEQGGPLCFDVDINDVDGNLDSVKVAPIGSYNPSTHQICIQADTSGQYCMVITAKDKCGLTTVDSLCVSVAIDECLHAQIEKTHKALQGQFESVNIYLNGSGKKLGGFDLLLAYDASALTVMGVQEGQLLTQCGWEYFTYRQGIHGNCTNACPSGLLRIVSVADMNNGAYHPGCYLDGLVGSLAIMNFLVSNDRTLNCQFSPISFYWNECSDNSFSSPKGDTLWVSRRVFDFQMNEITKTTASLPTYYGAPDPCIIGGGPGKPAPQRCVDFTNGGVDIICSDSIDSRGDINLNEVPYEIADAVMFTNYFIHGLSAFGNDPQHQQGSIAASDVNADGQPLTVADLVYLIRVVIGDAPAYPKVAPGAEPRADISVSNGILEVTKTDAQIGALYIVLDGDVQPRLHPDASNMELKYAFDGKETKVLVSNMNGKASLGKGPVLFLNGSRTVKSVEAGSYDGAVIVTKLHALPTQYSLSQNYPNPFNPVTKIEFALPVAGKWNLSIYNILGQEVATFGNENEAGFYKIEWDASRYASGVYFYRLTSGQFSATRKMVLLK